MARWSYLVLVVYIVLAVNAQSKPDETTTGPETTTISTSTEKPTSTSTTTTTTTSEKPTTTTTTTTKTTTTTENSNITTPAPSTTPAPPAPERYPKNVGHWVLSPSPNKDNITCLVLDAAIEIKLTKNNGTEIDVPKSANISGTCGENNVSATLKWPADDNQTSELNLTFEKRGTNFAVTEISVTVYNNNETVTAMENQTLYETPLNRSYKCIAESPVKLGDNVELKIASMRVEPFRATPFDNFSKEYECSADDVSTVVPFAVGISLALLVVIVLVAYLIGRRRSRARGYQSV